jgi:IS30 family transposase
MLLMLSLTLKNQDVAMEIYTHLSLEERSFLSLDHDKKIAMSKISQLLGRHVTTISRELKGNKSEELQT